MPRAAEMDASVDEQQDHKGTQKSGSDKISGGARQVQRRCLQEISLEWHRRAGRNGGG